MRKKARYLTRCVLATMLVVGPATAAATSAQANDTGNTLVGGFEIDGNFFEGFDNDSTADNAIDPAGIDWGTPAVENDTVHFVDGTHNADDTVLDDGHEDQSLETWANTARGDAPPAGDIHNAWSYSQVVDGDVFTYFAWDRIATQGQVTWYLELNHLENRTNGNGVSVPNRSLGDLRVTLRRSGHNLQIVALDQWVGPNDPDWAPAGDTEIVGLTNDSDITLPPPDGSEEPQQFIEFGLNLTELFGTESCGSSNFSTLNLRSTAGGATAELKDYLNTPVDVVSQCGELTIEKDNAAEQPVGGATFTVSPNPIPGQPADPPLTVTDNDANDADADDGVIRIPAVEPGTYTVTETTPPPGYIGDPDPQTVTIEEFGSETLGFTNTLGSISWEKIDASDENALCCATFTVVGTAGAAAADPWNINLTVMDNDGALDADPDVGQITVNDLPTGTYTVTETVPPTGYQLSEPPDRTGIVISADTPDVTITDVFANPHVLTDLSVLKQDVTEDPVPLDGAVFELYLDADGEEPGNTPDPADEPVGTCTTGEDGTDGVCTVPDLDFGSYYWFETTPPPGFDLPEDQTSALLTVNAANAGTTQTYTFTNPRLPGALTVEKLDASDEAALAGTTFDLFLSEDDTFDPDTDTLISSCTTNEPGTCTIEDLDFGTYFWVENTPPIGYGPSPNPVSDPVVINADNVGEVQVSTFVNPRLESELSVRKLDASDDAELADAEFDLFLSEDDTFDPDADTAVDSCTTQDDGTCTIGGLDFGTYFWVETTPPTGYDPPADPVSVPITINASNAGTDLGPFTFSDPRIRSELTVQKVDETTGDALPDAEFGLFLDEDGDDSSGVTRDATDPDDTFIGTCVTDDTGTCTIPDLDFGDYYWFELSAPVGYAVSGQVISDIITIDAANAGGVVATSTFPDPRLESELTVEKLDATDEAPLAGGQFALLLDDGDGTSDPDADTVVDTCTTQDDGTCTIGGLDFGTYFWVETTPPTGYTLPAEPVSDAITIDRFNAGTVLPVTTFLDQPEPEPPLPDTGADMTGLLAGAVLAFAVGGGMLGLRRRMR